VRYVSLYPLTKLLNCRPEFRNTIAAHLLTILLVLMPGLSLDSFELVNCWAVQTLLEEWIASRATEGAEGEKLLEEKENLIRRLQTIQDYITSFEPKGMTVVNLSATSFPQTLDWLHSYLLQCIEEGCGVSPSPRSGS
jgi:hypothetical protein